MRTFAREHKIFMGRYGGGYPHRGRAPERGREFVVVLRIPVLSALANGVLVGCRVVVPVSVLFFQSGPLEHIRVLCWRLAQSRLKVGL